ncbi:MAG: hypothetical protein ACOH2N_00520 [Devosia sp.]
MTSTKPELPQPTEALSALLAAIADAPDVSNEATALQAASDRFDLVRRKINDRTDFHGRIKKARELVNALSARVEIGKAAPEDLASAKVELADAREALELAPGRRAVMVDELESVRDDMMAADEALDLRLSEWRNRVRQAMYRLEATASQALHAAAMAFDLVRFDNGQTAPDLFSLIAGFPNRHGNWAGGESTTLAPVDLRAPSQIGRAKYLLDSARRRAEYVPDANPMERSSAGIREADLVSGIDRQTLVDGARNSIHRPIVDLGPQVGDGGSHR